MNLPVTPRKLYASMPRDYWHVREPRGTAFERGSLGGYYLDMRRKLQPTSGPTQDGFPMRDQHRSGHGLLPVTVTQIALGHYDTWLSSGSNDDRQRFLDCADWLVEHSVEHDRGSLTWPYALDIPWAGIRGPFVSGLAQGQGLSVLARAAAIESTGSGRYREAAHGVLESFRNEDIFVSRIDDGVFFEEYPGTPPNHVLNGHVFALWGLYDFATGASDRSAMQLFDDGTDTLAAQLPRYDTGYWSTYDIFPHHKHPNVASPFYHELHIEQLHVMFDLTGNAVFDRFAKRWTQYFDAWPNFTRALWAKIRARAALREAEKTWHAGR